MIALLLPLLGRFKGVIALVLIGAACFAYWEWSRAELAALHAQVQAVKLQADALKVEDAALRDDMQRVHDQLERANAAIADARSRALANAQTIRNRTLGDDAKRDPKRVQQQINDETAATFKGLQDATRK